MTTLAVDKPRLYGPDLQMEELPVIAADILYEGGAAGAVKASGHLRPLQGGDRFAGFVANRCDNASGAAAAKNAKLWTKGEVQLSVTGAAITDQGAVRLPVYASDDDTFSFSPVGGSFVGFLKRYVSSGVAIVEFDANGFVDPHEGLLAELHQANFTLDVQDTGKLIVIDTDGVVVTLPATAAGGGRTRFLNIGAYGAVGFSLSPNASDKVQGPDIGGTDNKDLINTKATAQRGDYVDLAFGEADGPTVTAMRGVWATEA